MADRLGEREVLLLGLDTHHNPGHLGSVDVFEPGNGEPLDYATVLRAVEETLRYAPRYRRRVLAVPAALAAPVWADDEDFDLEYHVRSSALPSPGGARELRDFVGRVFSRRLDRSRPLWELYVVEGLAGGRTGLVWKTHPVLVDGVDSVDLAHVLLTNSAEDAADGFGGAWTPEPEPTRAGLLAGALFEAVGARPAVLPQLRRGATEALGAAVAVSEAIGGTPGAVGDLLGAVVHGGRPPADSPLGGTSSEQRRWAALDLDLGRLTELQDTAAGGVTVNDIALAVLTGALRSWLAGRGELPRRSQLVALAPASVRDAGAPSALGCTVAPLLVGLPIGEPSPTMRLQQIAFGTRAHKDTGRAIGARDLATIAGFAPATLQAMGVRSALDSRRRPYDVLVTNVPGPQHVVYLGSAPLVGSWPILPLAAGHLLAIGMTSYRGIVRIGLTADRDAIADLGALAAEIPPAIDELGEALRGSGRAG